jgi:type IV secretory pathway VirB4 component
MKKTELTGIQTNNSLLNILTPITGLEYKQNKIRIGDNFAKIYTIIKYPKNVKVGWLSKLSNIPNTISTQIFEPSDNTLLIENMSKGIRQSEMIYDSSKDILIRKRALREIDDGQEILDKVEVKGETVGYMTNMIMVTAEDEETLNKRCKRVESIICGMQLKVRSLAHLLKEAFSTIAPFHTIDENIKTIARRNILMSDFIGGFPFGGGGLNDGTGFVFGKDTNGGIVVLNMWIRGLDRVNSNFVIMGTSGVGKSTATKHILLNECMKGTKLLIIDPERE